MISTAVEMKNIDIRTVDPFQLVDIQTVVIDTNLPKRERMLDNARQLNGNPHFFRYNNIAVKTSHINTTQSINDCVESHMRTI